MLGYKLLTSPTNKKYYFLELPSYYNFTFSKSYKNIKGLEIISGILKTI